MPTTDLVISDRQHSALASAGLPLRAYTPYGSLSSGDVTPLTGYCGQPRERLGTYLLGNGHRAYNTALMRFHSSDRLSPFGAGGINAYAYCSGDPVNRTDPSARNGISLSIQSMYGLGAALGLGNTVVGRMHQLIEEVELPAGVVDPVAPAGNGAPARTAAIADSYNYLASLGIRPANMLAPYLPGISEGLSVAQTSVDLIRGPLIIIGYAGLPYKAYYEWQRAGLRNMNRTALIGQAAAQALGLDLLWQGAVATGRGVAEGVMELIASLRTADSAVAPVTVTAVSGLEDL